MTKRTHTRDANDRARPPGEAGTPPPSKGSRLLSFTAATYDAEAHTVEVVISNGVRVRRWYGIEELAITPEAIDLSRVAGGQCKVLDSHNQYGIDGILGLVLSARVENASLLGTLKFGETASAKNAEAMVARGELTGISCGYDVATWARVEIIDNTTEVWRAERWSLLEVSFVSVPADPTAGVRSAATLPGSSEKDNDMQTRNQPGGPAAPAPIPAASPEVTRTDAPAPAAPAAPAPAPDLRQAGIDWERNRQSAIRTRVRVVNLPDTVADDMIARGVAGDEAIFEQISNALATRSGSPAAPARIVADNTDPAVVIERMSDALALRGMMGFTPAQRDAQIDVTRQAAARQYMSQGLLSLFTDIGISRGMKIDHRMPRSVLWDNLVANRSLSTSDFPLLLSAAANKILLPAYNFGAGAYFSIAARKTFNDFKAHNFLRAGDFPNLLQKDETGEFKYGTLSESNQAITALEYGRIVRVSRQIIINDDMSAFTDLPRMAGVRAAAVANKLGFDLFALNAAAGPTITEPNTAGVQTGVAMWEAAVHKNYTASGTAIDDTSIGVGVGLMLAQLSMDGIPLNDLARPRYILAAPGKIGLLRKYTALLTSPSSGANVNPWGGELLPLTDGNLTGNGWYLFAEPNNVPCFIYGYLVGQEGPRMASQEGFTTEGVDLRVAMDYAAGGVDFRGTYKNAGA